MKRATIYSPLLYLRKAFVFCNRHHYLFTVVTAVVESYCLRIVGFPIMASPFLSRNLRQPFCYLVLYMSLIQSAPASSPTDIVLTMVLVSSASLTTIPPFFEPGAPPPTLPILIAQTEVGTVDTPSRLLAQEEIGSGPTVARSSRSSARYTLYPKLVPKQQSSLVNHGPKSKKPVFHNDAHSEQDETDSDLTSVTDSDTESELILKPDGEAGRPGRGGYNLEEALKWDHKKYLRIKVRYGHIVRQICT